MCNLFDALVTISLMCTSHFILFWIVKPNTLWDSILSRLIFSTTKVGGGCSMSHRKETIISLHFLGFNFILLVLVQSPIAFNSFCSIDASLASGPSVELHTRQSISDRPSISSVNQDSVIAAI